MKHLFLTFVGLIAFSLSALAIDCAPPHVSITVINKDSVKIDSVYISSDSVFVHEKIENKLRCYGSKDLGRPLWGPVWNGCFRVKVKLANSTIYTSEIVHEKSRYTNYDLKVSADGILIKKNYDEEIVSFFRNLLFFAIAAMAFRTFSLLVKLQTKRRRRYVMKYTAVSILNLLAISIAIGFLSSKFSLIAILLLTFVLPSLIDYVLYRKDKNIIKYNVLVLILANIVFYLILLPITAALILIGF